MSRPEPWRLLIDGDLPGAHNMARDVAILEAVAEGAAPPTLRLYGWQPSCLSLGRHQGLEAADLEFCRHNGIDVVRRPTGGRALLHHLELTYAVAAPLGRGAIPRRLQDAYRRICGALVRWCRGLGIAAELAPGDVNLSLPSPASTVPCFEAPAAAEVVVAGRKLIGSAMRAHGGAILQHGAILLGWDPVLQAGALGLADDLLLSRSITTLAEQLGSLPDRPTLEQTLVAAFEAELGVVLGADGSSAAEVSRTLELAARFQVTD